MQKFLVYKATNKINGKNYIGITSRTIEERWKKHIEQAYDSSEKHAFQKAIIKYGADNFKVSEIDVADTWENVCDLEFHYIKAHESFIRGGKGYNLTRGGEGQWGLVFSEESKKKMSKSRKQWIVNNPEKHISMYLKSAETNRTPEVRKASSKRKKQWYIDNPEARKAKSKQTKQWIANNPEKYKASRLKVRQTTQTPEARKAVSERHKQWHNDNPEKVKEMHLKISEAHSTPEARKAKSEINKQWIANNPEKAKERQAKANEAIKAKTSLRKKCLALIKKHDISIETPSGKKGLKTWEEFENKVNRIIFKINKLKMARIRHG